MTYSLPSLDLLSEKLVGSVDWPADKPFLAFRFQPRRAPKGLPIQDMVSRRKYVCRTTYYGNKSGIPAASPCCSEFGLKLSPFRSMAEYKRTTMRTHKRYFVNPFSAYMAGNHKEEDRVYYSQYLPKTKGISVRKAGKIVGMMSIIRFPKNGRSYTPCSWISWLWVDGALPKEERKAAHAMLGGWLKKLPGRYFGGAIHAVNLKSQRWFLKMGARPVQVFFLRR